MPHHTDEEIHVGDSVVVKPGVTDPDMGDDLGGWQGRVVGIEDADEPDDPHLMVDIAWDSQTLQSMSAEEITSCELEGLDWKVLRLRLDEVVLTTPRDTPADVERMRQTLARQFIPMHDEESYLEDDDDPLSRDDDDESFRGDYPGPLSAISIDDVETMAETPAVFARGRAYLREGKIIHYAANVQSIEATVLGSAGEYAIHIIDTPSDIMLYCDCPDEGSICKHLVAVLLHYLETRGTEETPGDYEIPVTVRNALAAMTQPELLELVLGLAEARGEVLRDIMARVHVAPASAVRPPRDSAQVTAIKKQVARFFDELERQNEYEAEYDDWQHEYDEHETYPELETTFAITRTLAPDDRLEIYWYVLTCAAKINQEYALGTPQIIEAITAYADTAGEIAHTQAEKQPYIRALIELLDWSFVGEVTVSNAIKQALEHLCTSSDEMHELIDLLTQANEACHADWIAGYYRQLGEDAEYLRVREANLCRKPSISNSRITGNSTATPNANGRRWSDG